MKLFTIFAFIAPVFSSVNKLDSWNGGVNRMSNKDIKKQCLAFKTYAGKRDKKGTYVKETPDFCPGSQKRATKGTVLDGQMMLISAADNYGCWCDIENGLKVGAGAPVNALDSACRDLHRNYDCMTLDDPTCLPRELDASIEEYNVPISALSPLKNPEDECADHNDPISNPCAYKTCLVEAHFLRTAVTPVYAGDLDWINMWNDNSKQHAPAGWFNPVANQCLNNNPPTAKDRECCGEHPSRFPYNTYRAQCCNGEISPLGSCS